MVASSIDLYSTLLSTSASNPYQQTQSPLREEYLSLGIEAVLRTDESRNRTHDNHSVLCSEEVLYDTTYDNAVQTSAAQSPSKPNFTLPSPSGSQKKRRNNRHVSFVPPLSTTASINGYSRRQHSSIQVEEKVGTHKTSLLRRLENIIKEWNLPITNKSQKQKPRKSFEFLSGDFSSLKAQCIEIRETIATSIDNCTISMLEFCDKSYSNFNQEKSREEEDNEDKLTKVMLILCIPCAYLTAPKYGPRLRKVHVTPPTTTQPSSTRIEQVLTSQTRSEQKLRMNLSVESSSYSEDIYRSRTNLRKAESNTNQKTGRDMVSSRVGTNLTSSKGQRSGQPSKLSDLFDICADSFATPEAVVITLVANPNSATFFSNGGRFPLHAACLRTVALQSRQSEAESNNDIGYQHSDQRDLCDTADLLNILSQLVEAYPEAARLTDFSRDLPVHLLARQLWRLERQWIARVPTHEKAGGESGSDEKMPKRPFATTLPLFHNMTKCTEMLLNPIESDATLCQEKGSSGTLLPLHIGCLNGVSFDTLAALLRGYPEAAKIPCSKALPSVNGALPLDLFESRRLSTWILKRNKKWIDAEVREEFDRCSDLIFSYNPDILPYRLESDRLGRIKRIIISEAQSSETLTEVTQKLWLWLCTYCNEKDEHDCYNGEVKEILESLESSAREKLLAVKCEETGRDILYAATPACSVLLNASANSMVADKYEPNTPIIHLQRYSTIGSLCRGVFGVQETSVPTNFIILPYKVKCNIDGSVSPSSTEDLQIAVEFARFLSRVYTPDVIYDTIVAKSKLSRRTPQGSSHFLEYSTRAISNALVKIYSTGKGYLYLLDEVDGNPSLSADNVLYPIELDVRTGDIHRLFSLMQMGIQLMRGKAGLPNLCEVLLKGNFPEVSDSWYDASVSALTMLRESEQQLHVGIKERLQYSLDLRQLRVSTFTDELHDPWRDEITYLRDILGKYDPKLTYSGLHQVFDDMSSIPFWTTTRKFLSILDALDTGIEQVGVHSRTLSSHGHLNDEILSTSLANPTEISLRSQSTLFDTFETKSEVKSALSNQSDEFSRFEVVKQDDFYEDSICCEMSDMSSLKDLHPVNSLNASKPNLSPKRSSDSISLNIPKVNSRHNFSPDLSTIADSNEVYTETDSITETVSTASSAVSLNRIAALVADMDSRRSNVFPSIIDVYEEEKSTYKYSDVNKKDGNMLFLHQAENKVEQLYAAISAVDEEEIKLREVIDELKMALFPVEPFKVGFTPPMNKSDNLIVEKLYAATNAAIEEEIKLRENIESLKLAVYKEANKFSGTTNQSKLLQQNLSNGDDVDTVMHQRSVVLSSKNEDKYSSVGTAAILDLKTALDAVKKEEEALQQEIATLFELTSALETAEQEEKALWQQHDILRVALERDKWKIPFDYSN